MSSAPRDEPMAAWLEAAWMARYLERGLSENEAAWFEAYVLDKPHLVAAIERDCDLRDAVDAAGLGDAAPTGVPDPSAEPARLPAPTRRRSLPLPLALAASLLVGVLGVWFGQAQWRDAAVAVDPLLLHVETQRAGDGGARLDGGDARSASAILEIVLPPGTRHVQARLGTLRIERAVRDQTLLTLVLPTATLHRATTLELTLQVDGAEERRSIALPPLPSPENAP